MADIAPVTPPAPAPATVPADISPTGAALPVAEATPRLSVPVSEIFNDGELTPLPETVAPASVEPAAPAVTPPVVKPAEPIAPVVPPVPAAATPAPAVPEEKIKIGDKEYTKAEIEAEFKKRTEPVPAPAAAAPATPAPVVPPPTKEETEARETKWVADFSAAQKVNFAPTEEEMETILAGGKEGIALLDSKFNQAVARAVLLTRKSMYAELNPVLADVQGKLSPVLEQAQAVEYAAAESQFLSAYPEFEKDMDVVRQVGQQLIAQFPKEFAGLTRAQQIAEVASQADRVLQENYKRFPGAAGTWKDARKGAAAPVVPAVPVVPAAVVPALTTPPRVPAPASNSPAATPLSSATPGFAKTVAKDLQD